MKHLFETMTILSKSVEVVSDDKQNKRHTLCVCEKIRAKKKIVR